MRRVSEDSSDEHRYDDLLDLPHPVSKNHRHMSLHDRAAQFAPFAALTGYNEAIDSSLHRGVPKIELSDSQSEDLNQQIISLAQQIRRHPMAAVCYYYLPEENMHEKILHKSKDMPSHTRERLLAQQEETALRQQAKGQQKRMGTYVTKIGRLKSIDVLHQQMIFMDHSAVSFRDILSVHSAEEKRNT
ncbi:MAG: hypothetical protein GX478_00330 [Erysipelotrichaceae bacterium]|jgi:hypothetical protein|nr:hypothetical protein [Erysipelotrichaceae bacterium]